MVCSSCMSAWILPTLIKPLSANPFIIGNLKTHFTRCHVQNCVLLLTSARDIIYFEFDAASSFLAKFNAHLVELDLPECHLP